MLTDAVVSIGLHSHTHSFSLSVSLLPCLSLFHLKGVATPQTGSFEIQISLYPVLIISKVTPTRNLALIFLTLLIPGQFGDAGFYIGTQNDRWNETAGVNVRKLFFFVMREE